MWGRSYKGLSRRHMTEALKTLKARLPKRNESERLVIESRGLQKTALMVKEKLLDLTQTLENDEQRPL